MTLLEVLAVLIILGLLAGTLMVGFSGMFGRGKQELAKSGIALVASKLEAYRLEHGTWPSLDEGLEALTEGRAAPTAPYYLSPDQTLDPWNRPYVYIVPGPDGHPFEVISYGADGRPGGDGEDADISSLALRGSTGSARRSAP